MFIAFENERRIASGNLPEVALQIKSRVQAGDHGQVIVFDDETSEVVEVDVRGMPGEVVERCNHGPWGGSRPALPVGEKRGPGRPKLGVVGREVTLLPRHWEWLDSQPGGASVALRKLVEEGRRSNQSKDRLRRAQEAVYRFMSAMTGDLPGFEEALRAFYAKDFSRFGTLIEGWPADIRDHLKALAAKAEQQGKG